jgi:hypothetical protein
MIRHCCHRRHTIYRRHSTSNNNNILQRRNTRTDNTTRQSTRHNSIRLHIDQIDNIAGNRSFRRRIEQPSTNIVVELIDVQPLLARATLNNIVDVETLMLFRFSNERIRSSFDNAFDYGSINNNAVEQYNIHTVEWQYIPNASFTDQTSTTPTWPSVTSIPIRAIATAVVPRESLRASASCALLQRRDLLSAHRFWFEIDF